MDDEISPEEFSQYFKKGIETLGFIPEQFARHFGVSTPTIKRWAEGKSAPAPIGRKIILERLYALINERSKDEWKLKRILD